MSPVLSWIFGRISLVKQMPAALPETETVRIIQPTFRIHVVIIGSVFILCHLSARFDHSEKKSIGSEFRFLLLKFSAKLELWHF